MRSWVILVAAAGVIAAASGCGGVAVHPVKGKITFEGKPMQGGGSISFIPLGGQSGKAAGAEITPEGTYELMTHKPGDGSMVGEFRVVILQSTEREPNATKDGERSGRSISTVAAADRIPAIYADGTNSPLTAKVEAKANELNFDLKRNAGGAPPRGAMRDDPFRRDFALRLSPRPE